MKFVVNSEVNLTCLQCGARLLVKENRYNGTQFLGCPRWPECTYTREIPQSMIMRATGQAELFSEDSL